MKHKISSLGFSLSSWAKSLLVSGRGVLTFFSMVKFLEKPPRVLFSNQRTIKNTTYFAPDVPQIFRVKHAKNILKETTTQNPKNTERPSFFSTDLSFFSQELIAALNAMRLGSIRNSGITSMNPIACCHSVAFSQALMTALKLIISRWIAVKSISSNIPHLDPLSPCFFDDEIKPVEIWAYFSYCPPWNCSVYTWK